MWLAWVERDWSRPKFEAQRCPWVESIGARDEGIRLLGPPLVVAQSHAQGLAARPMARFPQLDRQPARSVTAFVVVKKGDHCRFPDRLLRTHRPAPPRQLPRVVAAEHHAQHLT